MGGGQVPIGHELSGSAPWGSPLFAGAPRVLGPTATGEWWARSAGGRWARRAAAIGERSVVGGRVAFRALRQRPCGVRVLPQYADRTGSAQSGGPRLHGRSGRRPARMRLGPLRVRPGRSSPCDEPTVYAVRYRPAYRGQLGVVAVIDSGIFSACGLIYVAPGERRGRRVVRPARPRRPAGLPEGGGVRTPVPGKTAVTDHAHPGSGVTEGAVPAGHAASIGRAVSTPLPALRTVPRVPGSCPWSLPGDVHHAAGRRCMPSAISSRSGQSGGDGRGSGGHRRQDPQRRATLVHVARARTAVPPGARERATAGLDRPSTDNRRRPTARPSADRGVLSLVVRRTSGLGFHVTRWRSVTSGQSSRTSSKIFLERE
jgi:hypothetical protein